MADRKSNPPGPNPLRVVDSVSHLGPEDVACWVVTGSHGGRAAAEHVLRFRPHGVVFNDAGKGKNDAGTAGLELFARQGIPAACVDAFSACIGDGRETLCAGVLSAVNAPAAAMGLREGMPCRELLRLLGVNDHECTDYSE